MAGKADNPGADLRSLFLSPGKRPGPLGWGLIALAVYALVAGLVLPGLARPFLERELSRQMGAPCAIRSLTFNPLTWKIVARGVTLPYSGAPDAPGPDFVRLARVEMTPALSSIPMRALVLNELRLVRPVVNITRHKDGGLSFQRLFPDENGEPQREGGDLFPLVVRNLTVRGGAVHILDEVLGKSHALTDISLSVPFASTRAVDREIGVTPTLSAVVNGKTIAVTGESRPFAQTRRTVFTLHTRDLGLAEFRDYIAPYTTLVLQNGSLHSELTLSFSVDPEKAFDFSLAGTVEVADLALTGPHGDVLRCKRARLDMENVLLGPRRVIINEALLEEPLAVIRRLKNGSVDWAGFFTESGEGLPKDVRVTAGSDQQIASASPSGISPGPGGEEPGGPDLPLRLTLRKALVTGGSLVWHDAVPEKPVRLGLENLDAAFSDVSSEGEGRADFTLSFGAGKTRSSLTGRATASPPAIGATLDVKEFPLHPLSGYIPESMALALDKGSASLRGSVSLGLSPGPAASLSDGVLAVAGLRIRSASEGDTPLLDLDRIEVSAISADTDKRILRAGSVTGSAIAVNLIRGKDGAILLPQLPTASSAPALAGPPSRPWTVSVDSFRVGKSSLSLVDLSLRSRAVLPLTDVAVSGKDFASHGAKQWSVTASAKPGQRGSLSLTAKGTLNPLNLKFSGTMDKADLRPLAPYLRERTELELSEATLGGDFAGEIARVPRSKRGGRFAVNGNLGLYGITLLHSRREFLGLGRLRLADIAYSAPADGSRNLAVGAVTLNSPRLTVVIDKKGVNTIHKAFKLPQATGAEQHGAQTEAPGANTGLNGLFTALDIGSVTVTQGLTNYRDHRVDPPYELKAQGVTLSAAALSLDPAKTATVKGHLTINGSPITAAGALASPFTAPSGEGALAVRSLDLARFNQYAEKYLGYRIKGGALSADVVAALDGSRLDLQNSVTIRNFVLGDRVDSPDAPDLPLSAAVSILSDRDGNIRLELPVSGTLGDPSFRLGGVVGQVIGSVIFKTVTSPVRVLDSLISGLAGLLSGGGPQNAEIVFPVGEETLDAIAMTELNTLGRELKKHGRATLEITGYADMSERDSLIDGLIAKALKQMKYASLPPERKAMTTPDEVRVGPDRNAKEYAALLLKLYRSMRFVRESTDPAVINPASTGVILRALRTRTEVTDEHLQHLADMRARAIYHALTQGSIDIAARIRLNKGVVVETVNDARVASHARIEVKP